MWGDQGECEEEEECVGLMIYKGTPTLNTMQRSVQNDAHHCTATCAHSRSECPNDFVALTFIVRTAAQQ